jgi:MoaD family protein
MRIMINFYSYFRDLTGAAEATETVEPGATIADLLKQLFTRFPKLEAMQNSMLIAVGVEYQKRDYKLKDGDVVSLFPPVQGG